MSKQYVAFQTWLQHGIEQGMKVAIVKQERTPNGKITFTGDVEGVLTANEFSLTFRELPPELPKQDLNRLRNAIHNEVGVTKQDIREMVEDAVKHLVDKKVKQLLPDEVSVQKLVDAAVAERSMYYWQGDEQRFTADISGRVASLLVKKIKVTITSE